MHGHVLHRFQNARVFGLIRNGLHQHADTAAAVDVGHDRAVVRFELLKAADGQLLADAADHFGQFLFDGQARIGSPGFGQERFQRAVRRGHDLVGHVGHVFLEDGVLRHEVGLAVDFHDDGLIADDLGGHEAFSRDAAGLLGGCSQTLLTKEFNGLVDVAVGGSQGLLAVHHAGAGQITQFLD